VQFGTDGVRGRANSELTASFALDLGRAAARVLGAATAVVGGDSRISTPMLEAAFIAGLASEGVEVIRLGVAPTAAIAFEAAQLGAMGAVVSASHNPYEDNGIKLFAVGGTKLPDELEQRIEQELVALPVPTGEPGAIHGRRDLTGYVEHLVAILGGRDLHGLRLVVDAANGAASHLAADVFQRAGAQVVVINASPDGRNINAGCGATSPAGLQAMVTAERAHAGIALDGDADRLIAVDERGDIVDGDHVIAICAGDMRERGVLRDDTVVVTVMANLGFHIAMRQAGIRVVQTDVGDRYVLEALLAGGYSLGGEQSGHVIFPDLATTGDGLLTGVQLLDVVRRADRPLRDLAGVMTRYPQVLHNVRIAVEVRDLDERLAADVQAAVERLGDDGRVLIRRSGTEPLVRVMVEAKTTEQAEAIADQLAAAVMTAAS